MNELVADLEDEYGHWGEHPNYSVSAWQMETSNDDTRLGYWEWVANQIDQDEDGIADLQITTEEGIADIIFGRGEGILDDVGVDEQVCSDLGRDILLHLAKTLSVSDFRVLKSVLQEEK